MSYISVSCKSILISILAEAYPPMPMMNFISDFFCVIGHLRNSVSKSREHHQTKLFLSFSFATDVPSLYYFIDRLSPCGAYKGCGSRVTACLTNRSRFSPANSLPPQSRKHQLQKMQGWSFSVKADPKICTCSQGWGEGGRAHSGKVQKLTCGWAVKYK